MIVGDLYVFFFSSRRRHTRYIGDWSSDVCSSDLRTTVFSGVSPGIEPPPGRKCFCFEPTIATLALRMTTTYAARLLQYRTFGSGAPKISRSITVMFPPTQDRGPQLITLHRMVWESLEINQIGRESW